MYQRQTNNTDIKPKTRNEAIIEIVGMFAVNWPRYDNDSWPQQMAKLLRASFKTTHPNTIIKAGWHVLQNVWSLLLVQVQPNHQKQSSVTNAMLDLYWYHSG